RRRTRAADPRADRVHPGGRDRGGHLGPHALRHPPAGAAAGRVHRGHRPAALRGAGPGPAAHPLSPGDGTGDGGPRRRPRPGGCGRGRVDARAPWPPGWAKSSLNCRWGRMPAVARLLDVIDSGVVAATQDRAIAWLAEERRVVQALLVEVEGSAPLPVGAMMVIDDQGHIEGSITGGCVEGAVVTEAEDLLADTGPAPVPAKLLRYGISDELAGTVGLMCGGIVHILVYELTGEAAEVERAVLEAHAEGRDR